MLLGHVCHTFLPIKYFHPDIAGLAVAEEKRPLVEDLILREFPPIAPALQALQFERSEPLSAIQEVDSKTGYIITSVL